MFNHTRKAKFGNSIKIYLKYDWIGRLYDKYWSNWKRLTLTLGVSLDTLQLLFLSSCRRVVNTAWFHYNMMNFLKNLHNRHPIARPWGWGMECLLWVRSLIYTMSQWLQYFKSHNIQDSVITNGTRLCSREVWLNPLSFYCRTCSGPMREDIT